MGKHTVILLAFFCFTFTFAKDLPIKDIKSVAIYWDASLSQKDKKIEKEFEFLDAYFKTHANLQVKLAIFNTAVIAEETFDVKSSNWTKLKEKLKDVVYDGASDFSLVNTEISEEMLLFFTDGKGNFGNFEASLYSPRIITISSKADIDKKFLHNTAFYNRGYFVNLLEFDIPSSIKAITGEVIMPKMEFVTEKNLDASKNYVSGIVVGKTDGLSNVNITVNDKNRGTITDENGNYKIAAEPGDVLVFSSLDMKSAVVEVGDKEIINVQLTELINELGPAIIKTRKGEEEELINNGNQLVNKKALGYAVQSIDSEDIGDDRNTLGRAIAGKFSGVSTGNVDNASLTIIRGMNSILGNNFALFVVNGIPVPRSRIDAQANYDFINPNDIADVTVLKGYAATNRFGAQGRNGVILITTKNAVANFTSAEENNPDKTVEIEYKPYTSSLQVSQESDSNFVSMLKKSPDVEQGYSKYLDLLSSNEDNVSFFLECSDYFFSKNKKDKGVRVLSNLAELYSKDISVLKILAFHLEKHNLYDQAELVYKRIINISPALSQAYLDLANTYSAEKKYKESIEMFKKITNNKIKEIQTFDGLNNQITNDFRGLLKKRNQSWKTNNIDQKYFICPTYPVRVVVEWSHPETEFNFRFVNSKKQYFSVPHNLEDNRNRMRKEIKEGFTSDEYILSDIEPGRWYLDVVLPDGYKMDTKYPKVLKIKVFTKFGTLSENVETHLVNLDRISKNRIVTSFTIQ
ncbi:TonB-dependent receptor plug domain-containing protein [Aquimarina mytili]|uniref:TonB-dependent receptor plug domain-containing protein n=1 Tax=Aquimarina mytili TaxID=874423 RepID=A0A937DD08_9FLAO|nr:TonB-dependent receptor plug domain-containing protein [Aquimarina mytili]MBL0685511.1 TonB-dependent receptor plug domain-containing protein [Aquimarina mytili]